MTDLANKSVLDAKINEIKDEIPSITNLANTACFSTVRNKIPNDSDLVKKAEYKAEINFKK